jgi:chemotaxis signal transduction protein
MTAKVILLSLENRSFALPLEGVRHILQTPRIWPLILLRPGFSGVFLHQGDLVPYLDLGPHLGGGADCGTAAPAFTVIFGADQGSIGLPADRILQIVDRDQGAVIVATADAESPTAFRYKFSYHGCEYPLLAVEALLLSLPR